jgi:hypothetical protein
MLNNQFWSTQLVALQYPNGREIEREVSVPRELQPGDEFTLVGREWRVGYRQPPSRLHPHPRLVCTPVDPSSPLTRQASRNG